MKKIRRIEKAWLFVHIVYNLNWSWGHKDLCRPIIPGSWSEVTPYTNISSDFPAIFIYIVDYFLSAWMLICFQNYPLFFRLLSSLTKKKIKIKFQTVVLWTNNNNNHIFYVESIIIYTNLFFKPESFFFIGKNKMSRNKLSYERIVRHWLLIDVKNGTPVEIVDNSQDWYGVGDRCDVQCIYEKTSRFLSLLSLILSLYFLILISKKSAF